MWGNSMLMSKKEPPANGPKILPIVAGPANKPWATAETKPNTTGVPAEVDARHFVTE